MDVCFVGPLRSVFVVMSYCFMYIFAYKISYALPLVFTDHLSLLILSLTQDSHCSSLNILPLSAVGLSLCECLAGLAILIFPIKFLFKSMV